LFRGASPALATLAATRSLSLWALTATLAVGVVTLIVAPKLARGATAVALAVLAFAFFGGYERLREGARKPFLIHSHLFSNGLLVRDIAAVNEEGVLGRSGWIALGSDDPVAVGQRIFRAECSSCHSLDGYQSIRHALPTYSDLYAMAADDPPGSAALVFAAECAACHTDVGSAEMREMLPSPDEMADDPEMIHDLNDGMIFGAVALLQEMGEMYAGAPSGAMIDTGELHTPYMPPFVGTDSELEALVAYLATLARGDVAPPPLARSGGLR
jgi:mono/diheme cytochrome c family protein